LKLKIDKEFKNLIPPLTQDEYKQLWDNLVKDGCRDALIVWNGTIIDGHNRYEICTNHGIEFKTREMKFESRNDAIEWIIRNQFGRRNITGFVRAELALRLEDVIREKAKENQREHGGTAPGKTLILKSEKVNTDKELSKISGVGTDSIWKARIIKNEGSEEVQAKARSGEISINKAFNLVRPKPEPPQKNICCVCGKEKPIDEFTKGDNECKECRRSRGRLNISRSEARALNESFPDEELEAMYEEMKRPPSPKDDSQVEKHVRNSIIDEFDDLINEFQTNIKKFLYMPQVKQSETSISLTEETIEILKKIIT
jgi:hypothetical protein